MEHSDAGFMIGKTHAICQDYAIAGASPLASQAIWLSDGCSSSAHTDIGARLLAYNASQRVSDVQEIIAAEAEQQNTLRDEFVGGCVSLCSRLAGDLGLPVDCLNATLLGMVVGEDRERRERQLCTLVYGDGVAVYGLTTGERIVIRSHYPANYPFYPAYLASNERREIWERVPENRHTVTWTVLEAGGGIRESETFCPEQGYHLLTRPVSDLRWAAILSDGVESFHFRGEGDDACRTSAVDYLEVIRHLTAFKNFAGEFVHRRMNAFTRECSRKGWHHNDDFSLAAVYFGEVSERN